MAKNRNQINIGKDFEGNLIQGDGNTIIKNEIDSEEFGQSLGEILAESARDKQWWEDFHASKREDSQQVMETVFVSMVSGLAIGACWELTFPISVESSLFFVILTIVLFNVTKITNFGLRHTIVKISFLSIAYVLLLKYTAIAQNWMEASILARAISLSTIGSIIGFVIGIIQVLFHPLED